MCGGDINNLFGRLPSYRSVVEATEAYIQEMARQGEAQSKLRLRNEAERSARIAKHRFEQFLQPILPSINAAFKKEQFLRAVSVEVNQIAQEGVVGGVSSFDSWLAEKEARFSARIDAIQARFSAQSDAIQARFSAQSDALEAAIMKTLEKGQTSAAERGETEMPAQLDEILNDLKVHYTDDQSGFDEVAKFLRQVESFAAIGSELSNLRASTNVLKASMAGTDELRASMEADTAGVSENIVELEASTAELEASMAGTEERGDELRASMGAGTAEVAQNIVELEARMAGTEERGDELRASMGAGTAEVAQNIVELEARMAGTKERVDELRASMRAGTAEVAQNIVELEARMAGTKERVDELRASMRAGTAESKAWTAEVAQNIVELEARTAESKARTAELEASTAEVVQNIVESKARTAELEARTAELEARTAERQEALRIQYEEMSRAVQKAIREMNELNRKAEAALGDSFAGENFEYTQPIMFSAARPLLMSSLRTEGGLQGPGEVREMTTDEPVRKWSHVSPQSPVTDSLAERGGDGNAVVIKPSHENVFMYCIQKIHELFSQILHFFCSSIPRVIYQNVSLLEIEQEVG